MISFIRNITQSRFGILLRNSLNLKPIHMDISKRDTKPITVSDAFLWRTDNGYKSVFKYTDILNLFYKISDSYIELHFYSKDNKLIKIKKYTDLKMSNEINITSQYLGNICDYGVFYIFHFSNNNSKLDNKSIIINRCYLGYSYNNNLYSFVHGNTAAKYANIYSDKEIDTDIVKTSLAMNQRYTIQKYFNDFDKNEFFFTNPTSKHVKFSIGEMKYNLNPGCTTQIDLKRPIVTIESNCAFIRPTVFSYKNEFVDVHHT